MSGVAVESLLAASYAIFLCAVAFGLDALAKHSHRRSELYRTAGFSYDSQHDAWECPEGERLHWIETDLELRLARYRARAHICNACPRKGDCTDSDTGRELTRALDPWPHSEVGRFHRGIAVAIVGFGILVIGAGAVLHHASSDLAVLGAALLLSTLVGLYLLADFRSSPSGFPWPMTNAAAQRRSRRPVLADGPTAGGGPIDRDLISGESHMKLASLGDHLLAGLLDRYTGAERVGFEPTRRFNPPTRFPSELLNPLGHLSGWTRQRLATG